MLDKNIKYALYGVNRVSKDFIYIFGESINVTIFFDDASQAMSFMGRKVYPVAESEDLMRLKGVYDKIIICDFEKSGKIKTLQDMGFVYGQDYYLEQDFFEELDDNKLNPLNKPVAVWGTGVRAASFIKDNRLYEIEFFIDTYKKQDVWHGKPVIRPEDISNWENIFIIVAVARDYDINNKLQELGLTEKEDYCSSLFIRNQPSSMLSKTIFDQVHYDLVCRTMGNHVEVLTAGNIYCCCSTLIDRPIGSIRSESFQTIWESTVHKIMCLSVQNGTYSFCKKDMCPFFIGRFPSGFEKLDRKYEIMDKTPKTVAIGFDATCNLMCETCRNGIRVSNGVEREISEKCANVVKEILLDSCQFFIMAGDGEVFVSPVYRDIYCSEKLNQTNAIRILSNGTLFNEKNWQEFSKNKTGKIMLTISVDAATKETYEGIRRGGDFDILKRNMEFASRLRREGKLVYFRMNFVVQRRNYKEMIPFVNWGLELGCDEVFFTKILNWGTYTDEKFKAVSMMEDDGITPKKELEDILDSPIMNNKIVDLGTIRYAHEPVHENVIENYYMGELERKGPGLFG